MSFAKRRDRVPSAHTAQPGPVPVLDTLKQWHGRFGLVYTADGATLLPMPRC